MEITSIHYYFGA